jgi:microcompartment protein CcmL/EutN
LSDPALALIEYNSIAEGIAIADNICKRADIRILQSFPVCPGKYITLFSGNVADVEESLKAGMDTVRYSYVDSFMIANVHPQVLRACIGTTDAKFSDALGVIETYSCASAIYAADVSAKAAAIDILGMRLAMGIGGKAYYTFTGTLFDVEIAAEAGKAYAKEKGLLAGSEVITSPHEGMRSLVY